MANEWREGGTGWREGLEGRRDWLEGVREWLEGGRARSAQKGTSGACVMPSIDVWRLHLPANLRPQFLETFDGLFFLK